MRGPLCLLVTLTRATFGIFSFAAPEPKPVSLRHEGLEVIFQTPHPPSPGFSVTQPPTWTASGRGEWPQPAGPSIRLRGLVPSASSQPFSMGRHVCVSDTWEGACVRKASSDSQVRQLSSTRGRPRAHAPPTLPAAPSSGASTAEPLGHPPAFSFVSVTDVEVQVRDSRARSLGFLHFFFS